MGQAETKRPFRLAVLTSHPIQYLAPFYAYLHSLPEFEVTALYMTDSSLRGGKDKGFGQAVTWDIDLLAGYPSVFLGGEKSRTRNPDSFWSLVVPEVWGELRSGKYDGVLIYGQQFAANLVALAAAKSAGLKTFVRGETHLALHRSPIKEMLRRPLIGALYARFDRALAIGSANRDFYRAMGLPDRKIFLCPYSVDNDRFIAGARMDPGERAEWRRRFGIPGDRPAILYAAKFTRRKHPEMILEAARRIRETEGDAAPFSVVLCGSGELEGELRAFCAANGLEDTVFTGFVNQADLPKLYGACDVFVLPSVNEPWALGVNEAMCAALPVVVSREVGCVADLVEDGVNGFAPEAGDTPAWTEALRRLVKDEALRKAQGAASLARISRWGYREYAQGLKAAIADL